MSIFNVLGSGTTLFTAFNTGAAPVTLTGRLLYVNINEFGFTNEDGSNTYVKGAGFAWDKVNKVFTSGEVTSISHYAGGQFHDDLLSIPPGLAAAALQQMLEHLTSANSGALSGPLLSGDDTLDGRGSPGGTPVPRTLDGGNGNDVIRGGKSGDNLSGGAGNDRIFGNAGNDDISGGDGADLGRGGYGDDNIMGGGGTDVLRSGNGRDNLWGGSAADRLHGGASDDILTGGTGADRMTGGRGSDTFVFEELLGANGESGGCDVITDFKVGIDALSFDGIDTGSISLSATRGGCALVTYDDGFNSLTIKLLDVLASSITLDDLLA